MKPLLLTVGAAAAWILLGHIGLLAILLYVWATAMTSTTNTAKTRALEQRLNTLVTNVGGINQGSRGQTSAFQDLSQTETGTSQDSGGTSATTSQANAVSSGTTGPASAGTAHTHDYGGHYHGMDHWHYSQVSGDYDNLVAQLNTMRQALINENIL